MSTTNTTNELPVIRTPYGGLNNALSVGGLRRGTMTVIASQDRNYKLGLLLDLYLGCGMANKPHLIDGTKKPTILHISLLANKGEHAESLLNRLSQLKPEITDKHEALSSINVNGFNNLAIYPVYEDELTLERLFMYIREKEDKHEFILVTIDDISRIKRTDENGKTRSLSETYVAMREFFAKRGTAVVTTAEFNDAVEEYRKRYPHNYLKLVSKDLPIYGVNPEFNAAGVHNNGEDEFPRLGLYVDTEIFISLEAQDDQPIIKMCIGKNRGVVSTDTEVNYKYDEDIGMAFDFDGKCKADIDTTSKDS